MELPHQSSNTCRLAWPWNWGAKVGHNELLRPSPVLPTSAWPPSTGALVREEEDATAEMAWFTGDMSPDPRFSSAEGLVLAQVTV